METELRPAPDWLTLTEFVQHCEYENISFGPMMHFAMLRAGVKPKKIRKRMRPKYIAIPDYTLTFTCDKSRESEAFALYNGEPFRYKFVLGSTPAVMDVRVVRFQSSQSNVTLTARSIRTT